MAAQDFKRKLTAILCVDTEGYSRLMGEGDDGTVRTTMAYQELMGSIVQIH